MHDMKNRSHVAVTRNSRSRIPLILTALSGTLCSIHAESATLNVCKQGCTYSSIQGAINNSASGDKIQIGAGTFFENLQISHKNLTLLGAGEDLTVIDGNFRGSVITLSGTEILTTPYTGKKSDTNVSISAVNVTHGSSKFGGGISIDCATLVLLNSMVASNQSSDLGGGLAILDGVGSIAISKSMLVHNRATTMGGAIYVGAEIPVTVTDSTLARNTAGLDGGAMFIEGAAKATISGTTLTDNSAGQDGGAIRSNDGEPTSAFAITNSTIENNVAQRDGGGVLQQGHGSFDRAVISHNTAGRNGGALHQLLNCGLRCNPVGSTTFTNSYLIQNKAGTSGAGAQAEGGFTFTNTTVSGNSPKDCIAAEGVCP
jgi:predicted outer membrane repeat protein